MEGWVDQGTCMIIIIIIIHSFLYRHKVVTSEAVIKALALRVCSPCPRLHTAVIVVINITSRSEIRTYESPMHAAVRHAIQLNRCDLYHTTVPFRHSLNITTNPRAVARSCSEHWVSGVWSRDVRVEVRRHRRESTWYNVVNCLAKDTCTCTFDISDPSSLVFFFFIQPHFTSLSKLWFDSA